jgi:seryl-tRNA synthetase
MDIENQQQQLDPMRNVTRQSNLAIFFSPVGAASNPPKRKAMDLENGDDESDPFQLIRDMMMQNQEELRQMNANTNTKLDELSSDVTSKLDAVASRVGSLESTVTKTTDDIAQMQQRLNDLEQEKLASHMEISGVVAQPVDANKADIKNYAAQLIRSFKVQFDIASIVNAFVLNLRDDKRKIVVEFSSVSVKNSVMKQKREAKDPRKIYFDHRMTPAVRDIFLRARRVAKEKGGRVFLYGSRVFYGKDNNTKVCIASLDDLSKIGSIEAAVLATNETQ